MITDIEEINEVVELLTSWGYNVRVYENYSGRVMYGAKTHAIVAEDSDLGPVIGYAVKEAGLSLDEIPCRSDSLGFETVYY